jgi:hypothetical protein
MSCECNKKENKENKEDKHTHLFSLVKNYKKTKK